LSTTRCLLAALGWAFAGAVSAQSAGPSAVLSGTDAGALERAQRLAASPLRMILQAGRVERRPAVDGAPAGDGGSNARPAAARAAAAPGATAGARPEAPTESGITVVLQLPADVPHDLPAEARLPSLDRPPALVDPIALDALDLPPWPDELATRGDPRSAAAEGPSARRVAWWRSLTQ
jgi:hypothetical protein